MNLMRYAKLYSSRGLFCPAVEPAERQAGTVRVQVRLLDRRHFHVQGVVALLSA